MSFETISKIASPHPKLVLAFSADEDLAGERLCSGERTMGENWGVSNRLAEAGPYRHVDPLVFVASYVAFMYTSDFHLLEPLELLGSRLLGSASSFGEAARPERPDSWRPIMTPKLAVSVCR